MPRLVLRVPVLVLSSLLLAPSAMAQESPRSSRAVSAPWEYGCLEIAQSGRGDVYVFCRFSSNGCVESELAVRPLPPPRPPRVVEETRLGAYDAAAARAIAALGLDGWELATETGLGVYGAAAPVLLFKRPGKR